MSHSIATAILEATRLLQESGIPEPRLEAGWLLENMLGRDRAFLITHADTILTEEQLTKFQSQVQRRAGGEPAQYITGHQEFFGLDFEVSPDVLIPRPETEFLVESALELMSASQSTYMICDVGTGSGCIPISLLHERQNAAAVAVDLSNAAVGLAARNARKHSVAHRINFLVADGLSAFVKRSYFDLIVSNPPYITDSEWDGLQREVREHEPRLALTSGSDGLEMVRRLLIETPNYLISGGHFVFEIGFNQRAAVEALIDGKVWEVVSFREDLQGIPRTVVLRKN
jgi:release factor glutamine methyltransferase